MTEHNHNKETVELTCEEHGYAVYTCPDCGKSYIGDYVDREGFFLNYIWSAMVLLSLLCSFATGRLDETINAAFDGAKNAATTIITLAPLMCFWLGIMNIAQKSGATNIIRKILSPIINHLFLGETEKSKELITMNVCANMLGMGNAATPVGIEAMASLAERSSQKERPTKSMCLFMVLNTTCLCLVPSTVLSIRAAAASQAAASVVPFVWIISAATVIFAVFLVKIFIRD